MGIKVGLIGAGSIAQGHLNTLQANRDVDEIYIADTSDIARQNAQKNFPKVKKVFVDYREMLKDESIRMADVCTPHYLHHQIVFDSLKAGKDVLVEKPIAMTLKEADHMINTARKLGRRLFVEMNQRFMPYHIEAKKLIENGAIGRPFLAVFNIMGNTFDTMNNPNHWKGSWEKAGGGAMIDTGYHAIYMMLHFLGKPKAVTGVAKRLLVQPENKADDNTVAILEFDNKILGTIAISYTIFSEAWMEMRHIYGTEGSLHIKDEPLEPLILVKENRSQVIETGQPKDIHPHPYSLKCAVDYYIDCIISGRESEVTLEEARDTLAVALAIYESSRKGKRITLW